MSTLDRVCAEANARLQQRLDERIAAFRAWCAADAERTRRSFGQRWRYVERDIARLFRGR